MEEVTAGRTLERGSSMDNDRLLGVEETEEEEEGKDAQTLLRWRV